MTHPFHDYLAAQVAAHLAQRRVVVWYDPRAEFASFINELRGQPADAPVDPRGSTESSSGRTRRSSHSSPSINRPRCWSTSPAWRATKAARPSLELEEGGTTYAPQLKRQARNVLRRGHTDG